MHWQHSAKHFEELVTKVTNKSDCSWSCGSLAAPQWTQDQLLMGACFRWLFITRVDIHQTGIREASCVCKTNEPIVWASLVILFMNSSDESHRTMFRGYILGFLKFALWGDCKKNISCKTDLHQTLNLLMCWYSVFPAFVTSRNKILRLMNDLACGMLLYKQEQIKTGFSYHSGCECTFFLNPSERLGKFLAITVANHYRFPWGLLL